MTTNSRSGRQWLQSRGFNDVACRTLPALGCSVFVQVVNQPLVRSTITIQVTVTLFFNHESLWAYRDFVVVDLIGPQIESRKCQAGHGASV
jgi:hypothetical protein